MDVVCPSRPAPAHEIKPSRDVSLSPRARRQTADDVRAEDGNEPASRDVALEVVARFACRAEAGDLLEELISLLEDVSATSERDRPPIIMGDDPHEPPGSSGRPVAVELEHSRPTVAAERSRALESVRPAGDGDERVRQQWLAERFQ